MELMGSRKVYYLDDVTKQSQRKHFYVAPLVYENTIQPLYPYLGLAGTNRSGVNTK